MGYGTKLRMGSKDNMHLSPGSSTSLAVGPWASHSLTASVIICKMGLMIIPSPPISQGAGRLAGLSV